jgi:hypothetical protein
MQKCADETAAGQKKTTAWFGDSVVGNYRGGHDPVGVSSQPIKFSSTASDQTCAGSKVPLEFISSKKDTRTLEKNIVNIFSSAPNTA